MYSLTKYKGILFVGDPHLWSLKPGKRLDENFSITILNKIEQAVEIAKKENLYLIFLGDLFHKENESNISMLTKLTRILKRLQEAPATVEGNHEKSQTKLSDDVALSLLRESEVIRPMEKNALWGSILIDNVTYYIGATPYGEKIPSNVELPKNAPDNSHIIWLTHHDLDFGDTYPGAVAIKEIKGVSMLVNGHIHKTKKPITLGKMKAHNPGNISRLSIDCVDHVPSVWKWTPELEFDLEPIPLVYEKNIFNLIGRQIEVEVAPSQVAEEITIQQTSQFVDKMEETFLNQDPSKTDDGSHVKDNIIALAKVMNLDKDFTKDILDLLEDTLNK